MAQYDFQIADYERIFRKRYRIVVVTMVFAVVFSVIFARLKPPVYTASASVKVDRNTIMGLGMEAVMYGTWDNIETQTKVITSFPVLLRAAKDLKLVSDTLPDDTQPSDERTMTALEGLRGKISTAISTGTNIINITATSGSPKEAREFANAMAFAYKNYSIHLKKLQAMKTREFVQAQLDRCKSDLADAEAGVESFSEHQKIPSVSANANRIVADASKLETDLKKVADDIDVVNRQSDKLRRRLTQTPEAAAQEAAADSAAGGNAMRWVTQYTDADPGLTTLNSRLIALQIELADQLMFYKKDHPTTRSTEKKIRETIREMLGEYQKKLANLQTLKTQLEQQQAVVNGEMAMMPANEMQYARLIRQLRVKEELNTMFTKKLEETLIAEAGIVDDVTIMSMATLPRAPINKNVPRTVGMGLFLGLVFGIIFAIVREMFDTSIGTIEDVERSLKMAVLAVIPHIHSDDQKGAKKRKRKDKHVQDPGYYRSFLVTHFNPKDPTAETYRILRTNIEYLAAARPIKTILLTSASMQEGKSTTIGNLAVAFAQQGKKILLLECNLRRPSLHRLFGFDRGPGTSDILIDKVRWQDCVKSVADLALGKFTMEEILSMPGLDNFHIIDHGHRPPNPTELLSSPKMDQLLAEVREAFDIVLVDAPPLLPVADSMVISKKVDGVILVYMVGKAPRNSLRLAKERLENVGARILGLVLNDIRPETTGLTYSSYYMYAYGKEGDKGRRSHHRSKA